MVHVGATRIFARRPAKGRQLLAYAMEMSAATEVAMISLVPVPEGSADEALHFIDLSSHPDLFNDLGDDHANEDVWVSADRPY